MAALDPIDARNGVSADLVEELRRAERVLIGLKDRQTAVMALARGGQKRYVIVPAIVHITHGADLARERPLVIRDAQRDLLWRNAIDRLREGHVPVVEWALGWAQVCLQLHTRLPKASQRMTAAEYHAKLVPMPQMDIWPAGGSSETRQTRYSLGPTTMRRRMRVGEPYIVRGAPA
jgi:hypothetical protein